LTRSFCVTQEEKKQVNPQLDTMTPKEASYWLGSIFDQVPVLQQSLLEVCSPPDPPYCAGMLSLSSLLHPKSFCFYGKANGTCSQSLTSRALANHTILRCCRKRALRRG